MRLKSLLLTTLLLALNATLFAQSKSEMQATIAQLTAQNDSLQKQVATVSAQNATYAKLIDTLSVMTGVQVSDLDTVKTVLELRAAARTADTDSLILARNKATVLQLTLDSVSTAYAKLQDDCSAARAAVASGTAGTATVKRTDQLMKLNGMLEQGLITKEEFLRMKGEILK